MRITIDTETERYDAALARLREAYVPPRGHGRPPVPYLGKFVLEPVPLPASGDSAGHTVTPIT
ncbi:hypothetical protein LRE75_34325 [Streptomyces sp. 372A]